MTVATRGTGSVTGLVTPPNSFTTITSWYFPVPNTIIRHAHRRAPPPPRRRRLRHHLPRPARRRRPPARRSAPSSRRWTRPPRSAADDAVRAAVRDLLRHGGYKPTGRGKPSAEYLVRAVSEGALGAINAAVDACNAVSLHSGLPISVVDLDLARPPLRIAVAPRGRALRVQRLGQEIDLGGLLCLFDADGPCANGGEGRAAHQDPRRRRRGRSPSSGGPRALPGRAAEAAAVVPAAPRRRWGRRRRT